MTTQQNKPEAQGERALSSAWFKYQKQFGADWSDEERGSNFELFNAGYSTAYEKAGGEVVSAGWQRRRLYSSHPGEIPQWEQCSTQEANSHFDRSPAHEYREVYTRPQQAAQVPLTDEQIFELTEPFGAFEYGDAQGHKRRAFARAIEAAHGITGKDKA